LGVGQLLILKVAAGLLAAMTVDLIDPFQG